MDVINTYDWNSILYPQRVSLIALNWGPTWSDFNTAWFNNGKYLSYDVQAKIRALQEDFYMAGINIRMDLPTGASSIDDLSGLGVSLMRTDDGGFLLWDWDGIPDQVTPPSQNTPLVALWQKTDDGLVWLAYRELDNTDFDIAPAYFSDDMESGTSKWTADSPWALVTGDSYSQFQPFLGPTVPGGNYCQQRRHYHVTTNTFDVSGATALNLVFWHRL